MRRFTWPLGALVLILSAGVAGGADWVMEKGSRLEFTASYEGEPVPGVFREFDMRLQFEPDQPARGRLQVTVALASAETESADVNAAIRATEWFDVARFPRAEFTSSEIRATGPKRYLARGILRLKDVRQEVAVPFAWEGTSDSATMEGELPLKRTAFGIGMGEWASGDPIGLDVKVKFKVKLHRTG